MTPIRMRSLQLRLAVQMAILYAVATAIAAAILIYQAYVGNRFRVPYLTDWAEAVPF